MIKIERTVNADTRTAKGEISKETLLEESLAHINHVRKGMEYISDRLLMAGNLHDYTKLIYINEFWSDFSSGKTGAEFKAMPWFQKHLEERHHLSDRCPYDVDLIDVMEELVDKVMAGMARSGKVDMKYFDINPNLLSLAYINTIEKLKKAITVSD